MRVFISWSGDLSKQVAELLREWIRDVLQGIETWVSTDDIDKGSLWFGDISGQLSETSVGILCLTRENITSPWILFEAGALAKGLSGSHVCPLLVNLKYSDLTPPLSMCNGTLPTKEDMLKLVKTINAQNGDKRITEEVRVEKAFARWWDEFEAKFQEILNSYKPQKELQSRSSEDMLQEVLQIGRALQRNWPSFSFPLPLEWYVRPKSGRKHPSLRDGTSSVPVSLTQDDLSLGLRQWVTYRAIQELEQREENEDKKTDDDEPQKGMDSDKK